MRMDLHDMLLCDPLALELRAGMDLRKLALESVCFGSSQPSPFLHATYSYEVAQTYAKSLGQEGMCMCIVRIDVDAWDGALGRLSQMIQNKMIDLSTHELQVAFFGTPRLKEYCDNHAGTNVSMLNKAKNDQEVLLQWRGFLPLSAMTVVSGEHMVRTGEPFLSYIQEHHKRKYYNLWVQNNKTFRQYQERVIACGRRTDEKLQLWPVWLKLAHDSLWSDEIQQECERQGCRPQAILPLSSPLLYVPLSLISLLLPPLPSPPLCRRARAASETSGGQMSSAV